MNDLACDLACIIKFLTCDTRLPEYKSKNVWLLLAVV